ncbi:hypothetical protein RUND412_007452, partial [Rhizina undulata]
MRLQSYPRSIGAQVANKKRKRNPRSIAKTRRGSGIEVYVPESYKKNSPYSDQGTAPFLFVGLSESLIKAGIEFSNFGVKKIAVRTTESTLVALDPRSQTIRIRVEG